MLITCIRNYFRPYDHFCSMLQTGGKTGRQTILAHFEIDVFVYQLCVLWVDSLKFAILDLLLLPVLLYELYCK